MNNAFVLSAIFLLFCLLPNFSRADSLVLEDQATAYRITTPGAGPCLGDGTLFSCALNPAFNKYVVNASFAISRIAFHWRNAGGNNCDGLGQYGAIITSSPSSNSILATSSDAAYLGCAGFNNGTQGTAQVDFSGQVVPTSFYLTFGAFDGIVQGGSDITVTDVTIYGNVLSPPVLSISPMTIDFQRMTIGMPSPIKNVVIENIGGGVLTPIITISGDFSQTHNCPSGLFAGQMCQVGVSFTPSEPGTRNGILLVSNSSPALNQQIELTGVGTLAFPLKGSTPGLDEGLTATTAEINAVFDHSMQNDKGQYSIYDCDQKVVGFLNEIGDASPTLSGHLKTGHRWSPENRPTELAQDRVVLLHRVM